jgi:transcriptional regulator with XRE-family HTH domain
METTTEENIRIIFGLKLKKLRSDKKLSLQELSAKSGVSVSYLNEIENGKKYPKPDKITELAKALETNYDQLVSLKINKNLTPVVQVLNLKIINDFLFDTFGVDKGLLMSMMASAPTRLSALINSVFEIARNYNLQEEHFYFSCLRSYQEMNDNYFEDIELAVDTFKKDNNITADTQLNSNGYRKLLETVYHYNVEETDFVEYPKLRGFRSVFVKGEKPTLLFNTKLTEQQRVFLFGRELGFATMKIDKRPMTTSWLKVESFDHVLNNFRGAYFAQALHINKETLIADLERFLGFWKWFSGFWKWFSRFWKWFSGFWKWFSGCFGNGSRDFGNGSWDFGNGSRDFGNGSRDFGNGSRDFGNGSWGFGNGSWDFGNGSWGFGNGSRSFGNGSRGFGNGSRDFGNGCFWCKSGVFVLKWWNLCGCQLSVVSCQLSVFMRVVFFLRTFF